MNGLTSGIELVRIEPMERSSTNKIVQTIRAKHNSGELIKIKESSSGHRKSNLRKTKTD